MEKIEEECKILEKRLRELNEQKLDLYMKNYPHIEVHFYKHIHTMDRKIYEDFKSDLNRHKWEFVKKDNKEVINFYLTGHMRD